jgi:hypothetical protein
MEKKMIAEGGLRMEIDLEEIAKKKCAGKCTAQDAYDWYSSYASPSADICPQCGGRIWRDNDTGKSFCQNANENRGCTWPMD